MLLISTLGLVPFNLNIHIRCTVSNSTLTTENDLPFDITTGEYSLSSVLVSWFVSAVLIRYKYIYQLARYRA
jgi:hypothetical protein